MGKKKPRANANTEARRDRFVGMVLNAIAVGLDGPKDKRALADHRKTKNNRDDQDGDRDALHKTKHVDDICCGGKTVPEDSQGRRNTACCDGETCAAGF